MRRGHIKRPKRRVLPLRIIIPLVFLIIVVGAGYSLVIRAGYSIVTGSRVPEPRPEPIIIRPSTMDPVQNSGEYSTIDVEPVDPDNPNIPIEFLNPDVIAGPVADERQDQFTNDRVTAYRVNSTELQRSVNQYANTRANQCAGEITVVTVDGDPLNVRYVPSTANNRPLSQVSNGSRHNVLLWAPDSDNQSRRWFLLVDEGAKTVRGWVRSDFCDTTNVVFAN